MDEKQHADNTLKYCRKCGEIWTNWNGHTHKDFEVDTGLTYNEWEVELNLPDSSLSGDKTEEFVEKTYILNNPDLDMSLAAIILERRKNDHIISKERCELIKKEQQEKQNLNVPHCPICGSTNLSKIGTTKKVGAFALFGIFSTGYQSKHWKCNNCNTTF